MNCWNIANGKKHMYLFSWVGKWNITNSSSSSLRVGITISIGVHLFTLQWYTSFVFICWRAPTKIRMRNWNAQVLLCFLAGVVFSPPARVRQRVKPISCEAFLASACATFDCNSPMPARPWTERSWAGEKLTSWKGNQPEFGVFLGAGKNKRKTPLLVKMVKM